MIDDQTILGVQPTTTNTEGFSISSPFKVDHHLHTSRHSPDSELSPEQLVEQAQALGLDAVVITEHDWLWSAEELAEINDGLDDLVVLSGVEISALEGHFLVYGLPNLDNTPPGIPLAQLLDVARVHEAAVVAAHPFRWDQPFDAIVEQHGPIFDAVELVSKNVTPETRAKTEALLRSFPMGRTGSSDAHEVDQLGCYYSVLPHPIRTIHDFAHALRNRLSRPTLRPGIAGAAGSV